MTLKSIELLNFKSHKATKIEFKHYTCLIGLNGSGKSNILDAVRFVTCQDESVGENWQEFFHLGENAMEVKASIEKNADLIVLSRKIAQKDGGLEEKFFIDSNECNKKKYQEVLRSLKVSESVVQQNSAGKTDLFNNLNTYIETISGSEKYKKPYDEISAQIKKETAALKTIFKKIKIRTQNREKSDIEQKKQKELVDLQNKKDELEKDLFKMRLGIKNEEISKLQDTLNGLESEINLNKREVLGTEKELKSIRKEINTHQIKYLETKTSYKKTLLCENEDFEKQKQQKQKEIDQIEKNLARISKDMENITDDKSIQKTKKEYYSELYDFKKDNEDLYAEEEDLKQKNDKLQKNTKKMEKYEKIIAKNKKSIKNKQIRIEELNKKVQNTDINEYNRLRSREKELNDTLTYYLTHKNNLKIEKSKIQIIETLKALFPGVKGRIENLFNVTQQKYRTALHSFITNKNSMIVDTNKTAIKCINYLESKKLCRLTFYCIDTFRGKAESKIQNDSLIPAINCVTFPEDLKQIMEYFLRNCYILTDESKKEEIESLISSQKIKIATLDGTIYQNNYITGGPVSISLDSNIISELNQISEKIQAFDHISVIVEKIHEIKEEIKILNIETGEMTKECAQLAEEIQENDDCAVEFKKIARKLRDLKKTRFAKMLTDKFSTIEELERFVDTDKIKSEKNEKQAIVDDLNLEKTSLSREIEQINEKIRVFENEKQLKFQFENISATMQELRANFEAKRSENEHFNSELVAKTTQQLKTRDQIERITVEKDDLIQDAIVDEIIENDDDLVYHTLEFETSTEEINRKQAELDLIKANIDEIYTLCASTSKTSKDDLKILKKLNEEYEKKKSEVKSKREIHRNVRQKRIIKFFDCFNSLSDILTKIMSCFNQVAQLSCTNKIEPYLKEIKYYISKDQFTPYESLSGGEKALAMFAFIFSVNIFLGSSFCFFDEIDSALDKEYAALLSELLDSEGFVEQLEDLNQSFEASRIGRDFLKRLQVVCISHKREFFSHSDSLIGLYKEFNESKAIGYAFD